jgi:hypothetical protein
MMTGHGGETIEKRILESVTNQKKKKRGEKHD